MFEFELANVAVAVKRISLKTALKRRETRWTQRRASRSRLSVKNLSHAVSFEPIEEPQKKLAAAEQTASHNHHSQLSYIID